MSKVRKPTMEQRESAMSAEKITLLNDLQTGLEHAVSAADWVVIVCPSVNLTNDILDYTTAIAPPGTSFTGRTAKLPGGGRISATPANQPIFVPSNEPFSVMFLGWETVDKAQYPQMNPWRKQARHIINTTGSKGNIRT